MLDGRMAPSNWSLINEKGKLKSQVCYLLQFKLKGLVRKGGTKAID